MSVLDNWKEAVSHIQANDDFDYPDAIGHYIALKKRMFAQIRMNSELQQYGDAEIGALLEESLNQMYDRLSTNVWELSSQSLEAIQNYVIDKISGMAGSSILEIQNEINKLENNIDENKKQNTVQINQLRNQLKILLSSQDQIETVLEQALKQYSPASEDLNTVINFLETFMINTVKWYVQTQGEIYINVRAKTTLLGYYKEVMEKKVVHQALLTNNITNGVVDLIANANTINDLLISFTTNNNALDETSITENIGIISPAEENQFGVQIKAKALDKVKTSFMKISHQSGLKDAFNAQLSPTGINNKSWACGVAFLGQAQNILRALGRNNVLFISGSKHYFMDQFITEFRSKNMYLAFEKGKDGTLTNQVGLQRFISSRNINKLLPRFQ